MDNYENQDTPIETQEQAQLLEQKFRDMARAKMMNEYISLEGISSPADVVEDQECEGCGADIPMNRTKALMTEFVVGDRTIWRAHPNAVFCIECASKHEKRKQFFRTTSSLEE